MKLLVDTHTHTVMSGHAYSTLQENARVAFKKGLQGIVLSDHGPAIENCAPEYIITSVTQHLPDYIEGVRVVKGIECNIMDYEGSVDILDRRLSKLEFVIASLHGGIIADGGLEKNTQTLLAAMQNPYIDVIGHPGNGAYPIDKRAFVKAARDLNKPIEINSHSFKVRVGSYENCSEIIKLCIEYDVPVVVSSDSHYCESIGDFDAAVQLLKKLGFPQERILSRNIGAFLTYIREVRAARIEASER